MLQPIVPSPTLEDSGMEGTQADEERAPLGPHIALTWVHGGSLNFWQVLVFQTGCKESPKQRHWTASAPPAMCSVLWVEGEQHGLNPWSSLKGPQGLPSHPGKTLRTMKGYRHSTGRANSYNTSLWELISTAAGCVAHCFPDLLSLHLTCKEFGLDLWKILLDSERLDSQVHCLC